MPSRPLVGILAVCITLLMAAETPRQAAGTWIFDVKTLPLERVLKNAKARVKEKPGSAHRWYVLGRLHSLAFARGDAKGTTIKVRVAGKDRAQREIIKFHRLQTIRVQPGKVSATRAALEHLSESVRCYEHAAKLMPKSSLAAIGLAWVLEKGAERSQHLPAPPMAEAGSATPKQRAADRAAVRWLSADKPAIRKEMEKSLRVAGPRAIPALCDARTGASPRDRITIERIIRDGWLDLALHYYRQAFSSSIDGDQKRTSRYDDLPEDLISLEAGDAFIRIQKGRGVTESKELTEIRRNLSKLQRYGHTVTPLILPLNTHRPLRDLLAPSKVTRFDLTGDGRAGRWPWLRGDTGILVWDPNRSGKIRSGRQLFGTATWWMFSRNGYEALDLLDDDRDGRLTGRELIGIGIWRDADQNGISDVGEVVPIETVGLQSLSTRPTGQSDGVPSCAVGAVTRDGRTLPTYDWTPVSLPPPD